VDEKRPSSFDRCAAHNLARGPDGACVLCRREALRGASLASGSTWGAAGGGVHGNRHERARWLVHGFVAAALGVAFLGGVALARSRPPQRPLVQAPPVSTVDAVPEPGPQSEEAQPQLSGLSPMVPEPGPMPPLSPAPPIPAKPTAVPPQRNYLDEAYAAIDKSNLYDNPRPQAAPSPSASPCGSAPRRYFRAVRGVPTQSTPYGVPPMRMGPSSLR
jgi:hypothetical protein